jgi:hypothetical protein
VVLRPPLLNRVKWKNKESVSGRVPNVKRDIAHTGE